MQMHTSGPSRVAPLGPRRFALQVTIEQSTHDKLRYAQQLLGHQVPTGDIARVLDLALGALISRHVTRLRLPTSRASSGSRGRCAPLRLDPHDEGAGREVKHPGNISRWKL